MSSRLTVPIHKDDHARGPAQAPITLVEYGDYECAPCGRAHALIKRILERSGGEVRYVFRNFPLVQLHPDALAAALAAEAAGEQRWFWEMHDALYENQYALELGGLLGMAQRLGLDMGRFQSAMQDPAASRRVRDDFRGGTLSGVDGTPTFFINGVKHEGGWERGALEEALLAVRTH